jgi:hypothetical protein
LFADNSKCCSAGHMKRARSLSFLWKVNFYPSGSSYCLLKEDGSYFLATLFGIVMEISVISNE